MADHLWHGRELVVNRRVIVRGGLKRGDSLWLCKNAGGRIVGFAEHFPVIIKFQKRVSQAENFKTTEFYFDS